MADKKIITDELLKLQTEKVLQVIADNVYQEEEYLEQEIDNMFDATPQEISYYESLINPNVVSENRLWSSKTIDEKLASAILEANKYTDQASTRNLTTEIVTATSDVTKENVLYLILSDASTNTYEQYMLIGGVATALGSTQVDLSNIYNKSEIDSKLDVKANKSEVLSVDSVQTTAGSETNDTVYSSKLTKDELDKKVNATDISTTIDENSTDDTIPTSKTIYDLIEYVKSLIVPQSKLLLTYTFTTGYPIIPQLNDDDTYECTWEDTNNGDGTTTRKLYGSIPVTRVNFYNDTNRKYLISLDNTASIRLTNMRDMFKGCSKLVSVNLNNIDTSNVTDMYGVFTTCNKLTTLDLSKFNTSKVTNMGYMFADCMTITSLDLSNFNTNSVTDMKSMFGGCRQLTALDLSSFNTSKVTNISYMFNSCSKLTSINVSNFNTIKVTNMSGAFANCTNLTSLDLSKFNTSIVTNMSNMFLGCKNLATLDLSNFDTTNVTNISYMFTNVPSTCEIYINSSKFTKTEADTGFKGTFKNA